MVIPNGPHKKESYWRAVYICERCGFQYNKPYTECLSCHSKMLNGTDKKQIEEPPVTYEYAIELYNNKTHKFIEQIDVYSDKQDALKCIRELHQHRPVGTYLVLNEIKYNSVGVEIGVESLVY